MSAVRVEATKADAVVAEAVLRVMARRVATGEHGDELARCRADVCHWIDNYVWTFDPRPPAQPNHLPFKLYRFQIELLRDLEAAYQRGEFQEMWEKSRDMGISWLVLAWLVWHWLFDNAFHALIGSRTEDLVDHTERQDTMFWKVQYIIEHLPVWMQPKGFNWDKNHSYLLIVNPETKNSIAGQSSNANFSRQGRYSVVLLDEFQVWAWARGAWTAVHDASTCRLVVCTAEPGSFAKELRNSGKIKVRTIHWTQHPNKDQAWYEKQKSERTDEDVAKELDINWAGSVRGLVYPDWQNVRKGEYPYVRNWPLYVSWDFGIADNTALIWWQQDPVARLWRAVDCFTSSGHAIDWYAPFVNGQIPSGIGFNYSEQEIKKIEQHRGWQAAVHYGDPAGEQRNVATGESAVSRLRQQHGIHVQSRPDANAFEQRYTATQLFLRRLEGVNLPDCALLDDSMNNSRFPEQREGSQSTGEITKPIHNWASHFRTACEYLAVNEPKRDKEPSKPTRRAASWERQSQQLGRR